MIADEEGFLYPSIDITQCIDCHLCENACPILQKACIQDEIDTIVYAAKNRQTEIREKSSSGGMFTLLATHVLNQGGIVFGAAFDEELKLSHIGVERLVDLRKLRGSKYVQSTIGDTYIEAKKELDKGRLVLFTGTPCQIGGLKSYLKKDYDNLYTQDLICHGVPSPEVFEKYLFFLQDKHKKKVISVNFRNKEESWKKYSVTFTFEDGESFTERFNENSYMKAFLKNLCLRPSCYDCNFKGINRISDITLADFWGVETILPKMDDDKGTSLIFIHSHKGERIFKKIEDDILAEKIDASVAILENASAIKSSKFASQRNQFMKKVNKTNFEKLVKQYTDSTFIQKIKNKIKSLFSHKGEV